MSSPCVRGCTILAHWKASEKDAACSRCCWWSCHHLDWGWSLSLHYCWCRQAFKETSAVDLRCPMRTPPFRRRGLRLRDQASLFDSRSMQQSNLFFPSWSVETTEISKLFRPELSRRAVTVLSSVQELRRHLVTVTAPTIDVGLLRTGCVIRGVGQDAPQLPSFLSRMPRKDDLPKLLKV